MNEHARSPMRFIAPLALVVATVVFLAVIAGAIVGGGDDGGSPEAAGQVEGGGGSGGGSGGGGSQTYEVQEGDTLDAIAAETGVSVEKLQELNPDLDPQSLIAGQELKLSR